MLLQWYLQRGRSSRCRTYRLRSVPRADHREHPEESIGVQGSEGRPGRHAGSERLWPLVTTQGRSLDTDQLFPWLQPTVVIPWPLIRFSLSPGRVWWWWVRRWNLQSAGNLRQRLCCFSTPRPSTRASRSLCTSGMWGRQRRWRPCTARWVHPLSLTLTVPQIIILPVFY